jgi:NAD(P)H-nitrite reductase large subunit
LFLTWFGTWIEKESEVRGQIFILDTSYAAPQKNSSVKKTSRMVAEDLKREWLLQNETICICKGIPRKRFIEAIKKGAATLQEVNRIVGSGGGDCKGERCGPRIERLLVAYLARSRG